MAKPTFCFPWNCRHVFKSFQGINNQWAAAHQLPRHKHCFNVVSLSNILEEFWCKDQNMSIGDIYWVLFNSFQNVLIGQGRRWNIFKLAIKEENITTISGQQTNGNNHFYFAKPGMETQLMFSLWSATSQPDWSTQKLQRWLRCCQIPSRWAVCEIDTGNFVQSPLNPHANVNFALLRLFVLTTSWTEHSSHFYQIWLLP